MDSKLKLIKLGIDDYAKKISHGEVFSMSRWGDGEIPCLLGREGQTHEKSDWCPVQRDYLIEAVKSGHDYYRCLYTGGKMHPWIPEFTSFLGKLDNPPKWYTLPYWYKRVLDGSMYKIIKLMTGGIPVIFVGPKYFQLIKELIPYKHLIITSTINEIYRIEQTEETILRKSNKYKRCIISFSAGMASNAMIDRLYPKIGNKCWMIDFGAVWDGFMGLQFRQYHKKLTRKLISKNLYGNETFSDRIRWVGLSSDPKI